jgi:hypothetical protein
LIIIGVDPGLAGGVAVIGLPGEFRDADVVTAIKMPVQDKFTGKGEEVHAKAIWEFIQKCRGDNGGVLETIGLFVLERVGSMAKKRGGKDVKQGTTSMFNFGDGYGKIRGIVDLFDLRVEYPLPQKWQKSVLPAKGCKGNTKAAAISFVQRRYPELSLLASPRCRTPHNGIADAVCLAEYGRRLLGPSGE